MTKATRPLPKKFLAGMIAVRALPGSPRYDGNYQSIIDTAAADAEAYREAGVDCLVLENDHDVPFIKPPLPQKALEVMSAVAYGVRELFTGPIGIQLLEGANIEALEVARHADLDFLRVESYVYAHVGGAGLVEACAGPLLRRRKELNVEHIRVFADIKKKHCSHALTADLDITDEAKQAEFFFADGLVVTGARTGEAPSPVELQRVKSATSLPVVVGSGMTAQNIGQFLPLADGFIVGSTFRRDGKFLEALDPARLAAFMKVFRATT